MTDLNRRNFIARTGIAVTAIPLAGLLNQAGAADLPMVDPSSPNAVNLKYVATSTTEGQKCSNCALFQGTGDGKGNCPLFQGAQVGEEAWCSAWVKKPA